MPTSGSAARPCAKRCASWRSRGWSNISPARITGRRLVPTDILQLFELRHVLERHAIDSALPLPDPQNDLEPVRAALERMDHARDALDRDDAHRAFHAAVVTLADNRQLDIALAPILLKLQLPMAKNLREEARQRDPEDGIERHHAILAALETNDAAVVVAALRHHGQLDYLGLPGER